MSSRKLNGKLCSPNDRVRMPPKAFHATQRKHVVVPAILAQYVPTLRNAALAQAPAHGRTLLGQKSRQGYTISRYVDGYELVFPDGRKIESPGIWGMLAKVLFRRPK